MTQRDAADLLTEASALGKQPLRSNYLPEPDPIGPSGINVIVIRLAATPGASGEMNMKNNAGTKLDAHGFGIRIKSTGRRKRSTVYPREATTQLTLRQVRNRSKNNSIALSNGLQCSEQP
ncbi:hypothetical protein AAHC03_0286 [Spirometra sp. Aus1]